MGLGRENALGMETADALWEGQTETAEDWSAHRHTDTDTHRDRPTKVKTVYPPVSLHSLGGYNDRNVVQSLSSS